MTTAPAVKANLLTLLAARPALAGVGMNWAAPVDADLYAKSGEDIYLGDIEQREEWPTLGPLHRDEHYRLTVFAQVHRKGNNPQGTEERCWTLVAEIAAALRADPTVSAAIAVPAREDPYAQFGGAGMATTPAQPQGWLAKATVTVAVGARI